MSALMAAVGWVGAALLVVAYGLVSTGRLTGSDPWFQLLNIVGGVALTVNTAYHGAWPSAALNVVWVVVGLGALVRRSLGGAGGAAGCDRGQPRFRPKRAILSKLTLRV